MLGTADMTQLFLRRLLEPLDPNAVEVAEHLKNILIQIRSKQKWKGMYGSRRESRGPVWAASAEVPFRISR